jgi:tetrahydromethanopterin S-methyltransferase subunit B
MALDIEVIDPPQLIGVENRKIKYSDGYIVSRPFCHFRWHGDDYWLMGRTIWKNTTDAGKVLLRRPNGKKTYRTAIRVSQNEGTPKFNIIRPSFQLSSKDTALVFLGFHLHLVVDMNFVREEDERLSALTSGQAAACLADNSPIKSFPDRGLSKTAPSAVTGASEKARDLNYYRLLPDETLISMALKSGDGLTHALGERVEDLIPLEGEVEELKQEISELNQSVDLWQAEAIGCGNELDKIKSRVEGEC